MAGTGPGTGRTSDGKFGPGNKLAVGNPTGTKGRKRNSDIQNMLLAAFHNAVSVEKWADACRKLLDLACNGNIAAWKAIAPYAMGAPPVHVAVDVGVDNRILVEFGPSLDRIWGGPEPEPGETIEGRVMEVIDHDDMVEEILVDLDKAFAQVDAEHAEGGEGDGMSA